MDRWSAVHFCSAGRSPRCPEGLLSGQSMTGIIGGASFNGRSTESIPPLIREISGGKGKELRDKSAGGISKR